jgi:membrane-associated protein
MSSLLDLVLRVDEHLMSLAIAYGRWIYALLFAIVFAETGLVVAPFLPGDSLLFAAGALAGAGVLDPVATAVLLMVAAIGGDAVNYSVGRAAGPRIFSATDTSSRLHRMLNHEHLNQAHAFFERHGGKAIVLARFVPIVRTFVPFVAGAGSMSYPSFAIYNVTGGIAWVLLCVGGGYLFGNVPVVKNNFSLVAAGIVFVSVLPMVVEFVRARRRRVIVTGQREVRTPE